NLEDARIVADELTSNLIPQRRDVRDFSRCIHLVGASVCQRLQTFQSPLQWPIRQGHKATEQRTRMPALFRPKLNFSQNGLSGPRSPIPQERPSELQSVVARNVKVLP